MNKINELYITSTKNNMGKNDYKRYDFLNHLLAITFKQACDITNDPIYLNYSQTKPRGRRREEDKLEIPNEIDTIRCNSITAAVAQEVPSPSMTIDVIDSITSVTDKDCKKKSD